ncbi:hypothetical protein LNKW23_38450 [Paralimibaculum aggregatum]|uniref:Lysozyme inhibitor LprI-like N-terminal domain-containing protein n=1 Tax=Paralimibaculum aggregatum TaxID=3036245 RepID=A0ABQ6LS08_9RHOB|nr:lysozyme inhibitor LprI family protein [Limibaculum sp. NKW23]GMG84629.1 hypothetical protein LNKW23_38450 [Limibaculum sp. NKW23]
MRIAGACLGVQLALAPLAAAALCEDTGNNLEFTACMAGEAEAADAELNRIWTLVLGRIAEMDHLSAGQRADWRARLVAAQRSWIAFKDTDCHDVVGYEWWGGSGAGSAIAGCLHAATTRRTRELVRRYDIDPDAAPLAMRATP